ncbi:uncharacterized protein LOC122577185 isoform X2 [Bombus pyrosoma]|uniref:uncharacterized protein LOC122577185 isoform X2 n=1 Tax=Bombus pyrosoma TaxID=396416 RepID=UPI001CB8B7B8|nr:uncharacterized protein LOC122577185 isoform X2 [Bombus pyrosoma]
MKHNRKHHIATITIIIRRIYRFTIHNNNILLTTIINFRFSIYWHDISGEDIEMENTVSEQWKLINQTRKRRTTTDPEDISMKKIRPKNKNVKSDYKWLEGSQPAIKDITNS